MQYCNRKCITPYAHFAANDYPICMQYCQWFLGKIINNSNIHLAACLLMKSTSQELVVWISIISHIKSDENPHATVGVGTIDDTQG